MSGGVQVPGPEDDDERRFRLRVAEQHAEQHADGAPPSDDPRAAAVVEALEHTRADLAAAPTPPLPPHVLAGIDRALAAEARRAPAPPTAGQLDADADVDHGSGRRGRGDRRAVRARRRTAALLVAAAVLVLGLVAGVVGVLGRPGAPDPAPLAGPDRAAAPVVRRDDPVAALRAGLGGTDTAAPVDRTGCLAAHGVAPGTRPLGQRMVVVDGTPAVLFVLPTGVAGRFRVLVVGEACAAGAPSTVSDGVVGR